MKAYVLVRDWVDRCWAGPSYKAILLPTGIIFLAAMLIENEAAMTAAWVSFGLWTIFCGWRWWLLMRAILAGGDTFGIRKRKNKEARKNDR